MPFTTSGTTSSNCWHSASTSRILAHWQLSAGSYSESVEIDTSGGKRDRAGVRIVYVENSRRVRKLPRPRVAGSHGRTKRGAEWAACRWQRCLTLSPPHRPLPAHSPKQVRVPRRRVRGRAGRGHARAGDRALRQAVVPALRISAGRGGVDSRLPSPAHPHFTRLVLHVDILRRHDEEAGEGEGVLGEERRLPARVVRRLGVVRPARPAEEHGDARGRAYCI